MDSDARVVDRRRREDGLSRNGCEPPFTVTPLGSGVAKHFASFGTWVRRQPAFETADHSWGDFRHAIEIPQCHSGLSTTRRTRGVG
ncbi:MAG: hypothetical protein M3Z37_05170 [Candidatus Eremiobacteraeota bacterium]|nr:hypothetical protein [Candidatus Eremiobacteraeota bacterium]